VTAATRTFDGVSVVGHYTIGGRLEREGPLGHAFDDVWRDDLAGEVSWEAAEAKMAHHVLDGAARRGGWALSDVDLVVGGDLLDQLVSTNFAARAHGRPTLGVFAACASFTEAVGLAALWCDRAGARVLAGAWSHHLSVERQFRFPIEFGYQRTPTASWTATAAGALALGAEAGPVRLTAFTVGKVVDPGSTDPMDMGTAMAPAARDSLNRHLTAVHRAWEDYDRVYTGDLGFLGSRILVDLMNDPAFARVHDDCGRSLYDVRQDTHNGGSGTGCVASVVAGHVVPRLESGEWRRVLVAATGALFSPTSYQQGESIPAVSHVVELEAM
jgi:stage V sporulation protein AD